MPHTSVLGVLAEQTSDHKTDHDIEHSRDKDLFFVGKLQRIETGQHQHRHDHRNERQHLALWNSRVTVEVGQHASNTAQTSSDQTMGWRNIKKEMPNSA